MRAPSEKTDDLGLGKAGLVQAIKRDITKWLMKDDIELYEMEKEILEKTADNKTVKHSKDLYNPVLDKERVEKAIVETF